jgi:hypothetical protein
MISARLALLRQAQEYFHAHLLGVVKWDDVMVDKPIPIPAIKGHRDQGKFKDLVIAHFNGFRMELMGPFESDQWPLGKVTVTRGAMSAHGPLDASTWVRIADFIKEQKAKGDDDGTVAAGEDWGH